MPTDPELAGNLTTSLAQHDPLSSLRVVVLNLDERPVSVAWVSTDGFGGAFTSSDWSAEVGADLVRAVDGRSPTEVAAAIPEWLSEPADVAGDDATMAVLLRPVADTVAMGSPAGRLDFANRPAISRMPKSVSEVADATPDAAPASASPPTAHRQPATAETASRPPSPDRRLAAVGPRSPSW